MKAPTDYTAVRCLLRDGEVYAPLQDGDRLAGHQPLGRRGDLPRPGLLRAMPGRPDLPLEPLTHARMRTHARPAVPQCNPSAFLPVSSHQPSNRRNPSGVP